MAVPRNFVFSENIAHSTLIVIDVVRAAVIAAVVIQRGRDISVIIAGRPITIAVVPIPVSVAGVVGRIGICVGSVWVAPAPPRTPQPGRGEVADEDDLIEMLEATKPIVSIKVSMVKASKAQT